MTLAPRPRPGRFLVFPVPGFVPRIDIFLPVCYTGPIKAKGNLYGTRFFARLPGGYGPPGLGAM